MEEVIIDKMNKPNIQRHKLSRADTIFTVTKVARTSKQIKKSPDLKPIRKRKGVKKLPDVPKQTRTAYNFFLQEKTPELKA
jgi:hypothetical protein